MILEQWEQTLIDTQRIAHLATAQPDGQPSVVPVVYAYDGTHFYTPLDGKPKRVELSRLRRVRDIAANPLVALVFDEYDEDWRRLAWVQVRGSAQVVVEGEAYQRGLMLLAARYQQYQSVALVGRPLLLITPTERRSWRASPVGI
jgi:PPOX class probable F420-dependent enzyme